MGTLVSKKAKVKAEEDEDVEVLQVEMLQSWIYFVLTRVKTQLSSMEASIAELRKKLGQKTATKAAVKRERSPITLHTKGEIIDLTLD